MINATMCFLRYEGKTLFIYRNRGVMDIHNGWYVAPGGKTERGERGIDSIIREFREETGLVIKDPKLRAIVTFYNEGRLLGGKANPDDWCVEVYEANTFTGILIEEHEKAKPVWVNNSELPKTKMYEGDRKILELIRQDGVFQVLVQYEKEELIKFGYTRVA